MSGEISYKPSAFYFRSAIRAARSIQEVKAHALHAVRELEALKEWVREQGMIPPRRFILDTEARDKGLLADDQAPMAG